MKGRSMSGFAGCLPWILLAAQALLPLAKLVAAVFGWNIKPANGGVYMAALAVISIATVIASFIRPESRNRSGAAGVCLTLALPMSVLNALMLSAPEGTLILPMILVNTGSCILMFARCGGLRALRIIAGVLTCFLMLLTAICMLFSGFGVTEEAHSLPSPDGKYMARVLNVDQGALGGDTVVRVQRMKLLGLPIDDIVILDTKPWMGDWGRVYSLGLTWVDIDTLKIDGAEYDF